MTALTLEEAPTSNTLRRVAVWQLAGAAIATVVLPLLHAIRLSVFDPPAIGIGWMVVVVSGSYWTLVTAIMLVPLTSTALIGWVWVARRAPALESRYAVLLPSLLFVALLIAVVAGLIASWEAALNPSTESFLQSALGITRSIVPGLALGIVAPRLLLRSLRPGTLVGRS